MRGSIAVLSRLGACLACYFGAVVAAASAERAEPQRSVETQAVRLVIAHDDPAGSSGITTMRAKRPWRPRPSGLSIGANSVVRTWRGLAYVVSRDAGTIHIIDPLSGATHRIISLGAQSAPQDIALVSERRAYVTRQHSSRLLRLDPETGTQFESLDLSSFADADGNPDLAMMAIDRDRLFIQLQRLTDAQPGAAAPLLAVVDLDTEQLIDVDPARAGIQAVRLRGTAPKHKMQVLDESRRLVVGATGGFFDQGGIELIDLDRLRSVGLVVREADGLTGADIGAFVMVSPEVGYLVFSTDLILSSHLRRFTLSGGVDPGRDLYTTVDYFVPSIGFDLGTGRLFVPDGGKPIPGIAVLDARSGKLLTTDLIPLGGRPTDLDLLSP